MAVTRQTGDRVKARYLRARGWRVTVVWACKLEEFIHESNH